MRDPQASKGSGAAGRVKTTRASQVAEALRQSILRGDLEPGAKVSLDQLREVYDVSLSPMREAISRLASAGLVEFEDQRGYRVAPVSVENLREVTKLRALLECQALTESIAVADLDWESTVLGALHRLNRVSRDPVSPETSDEWEAAHAAFHSALIAGCGMPMLLEFCNTLQNLNDRYRRIFGDPDNDDRNVRDEHTAIAEAAVARNSEMAALLLRTHILRTGEALAKRVSGRAAQTGRAAP